MVNRFQVTHCGMALYSDGEYIKYEDHKDLTALCGELAGALLECREQLSCLEYDKHGVPCTYPTEETAQGGIVYADKALKKWGDYKEEK